jgi:hypothetical protein
MSHTAASFVVCRFVHVSTYRLKGAESHQIKRAECPEGYIIVRYFPGERV